jgi:hypothetical protein
MRKQWVVLAAVFLLLAGCSTNTMSEVEEPPPSKTMAKPTLSLQVTTAGRSATLIITTNLRMSEDDFDMERMAGEGHIHLYLDDGEKLMIADKQYTFKNLKPGKHTIKVSLHNNDHTPYDVAKQIDFVIK